ncbi:MAG: tetratricopeptide repeat protein [Nitrospirae bacterium]|nr:tetratricopeptide repeat protein [Nitrospirota bacterium]
MNTSVNVRISQKRTLLSVLVILLVAGGIYANSLSNGFVLDDELIIAGNPATRHLSGIGDVLFSPDVIKPYYRPLNRASYLIDYQLFGLNPAWFHAINIIIHALSAVLLYLVASRLLADNYAALFAALLFAVHPANSEAINFISARNTLLAGCFSLASLLAFMKAREKGVRLPFLSAFLFFLGLLSKETAFMLLVVIAVYTFSPSPWFVGKKLRDRLISLVPYLAAVVVYFAMRFYSLQGMFGTDITGGNLFSRLAMNYHIIPQYIGLLLFPIDLTIFHTALKGGFATHLAIWIALFIAVWLWLVARRRNQAALFGLVWCVVNYAPISNIVPIPSEAFTERFLYMPAIGFFIIAGACFERLQAEGSLKKAVKPVAVLLLLLCAAMAFQRNRDWMNDYTLFASGVKNDPASAEARFNLGTALLQDKNDSEAARREWEAALSLDPRHADALMQMGTYAAMTGDLRKAEQFYLSALAAPPGRSDPDKCMAHFNLGKIYEKQRRPQEALQQYELFLNYVSLRYNEYTPVAAQRAAHLRIGVTKNK